MNKAGIKTSFKSLAMLIKQIKKHRGMYLFGAFLSVIGDFGFNAAFAYGTMFIMQGLEQDSFDRLQFGLIFLVGSILSVILIVYFGSLIFNTVVAKISGRLRRDVFDHMCKLPVSWFEERHSGDIISRLTNDIQAAENSWGGQLIYPIGAVVSGIGSAVVMVSIDWLMGLIAISIGVGTLFITTRFISPIKKCSDDVQGKMSETTQRFVDILVSSKVARIFNLSSYLIEKLEDASGNVYKSEMHRRRWQAGQNAVNNFGVMMGFIGIVLIGGVLVVNGRLSFAELLAISQMSNGIIAMFWILSSTLGELQQSLAGAERVLEVLDTPVEDNDMGQKCVGNEAVGFDKVSFSYEEGTLILDQINECIRKGETVALVGGSGGGKSTILKLVMGFYKPDEGAISVMGDNPRDSIAYVPQTNYLFSGTIRENIAYGKDGATDNEIVEAAKAAMAHDFIMDMQEGYDTMVGERGSRLSGGQRQRIAIARAIVKNAPILLLDEATSSLDSEAERLVQKAIDKLIEGRTSIIVAHRLSTIRHADRILVLEGGKVVEKGEHKELIQKDGRYAYYYNLQFDTEKAG